MNYRIMEESDMDKVIKLYIEYYNNIEESCWTYETVYKRIHPILSREYSYCMVLEENSLIIGFALGYFEQYDDLFAYSLDEIVIDYAYQRKGLGSNFMLELEKQVKNKGASMIQLKAVDDDMHEQFYGKLQYKNTHGFVSKAKWL